MEHYEIEIEALPKEKWKGVPIPLVTRSDSYYDLEISPLDQNGCTVALVRKPAEKEIVHTPEEYDFPDSLYQDHWEKSLKKLAIEIKTPLKKLKLLDIIKILCTSIFSRIRILLMVWINAE